MATSPLFGWSEPDDTDLVKDGAAAIRTLGNAIDTSMGDLLGGTTGQVLSKNSNTNMDFTWVTSDDANAIQNTIVDAKGDLIGATAADTPARLAVGTNGQVLTADSTASTGLAWATPSASSGPAFRAFRSSTAQSFTTNVFTKVQFNGETFDTDSCFDSTTNFRFTPTKAGYYQVQATIEFGGSADTLSQVQLYKNGSAYSNLLYNTKLPATVIAGGSDIVALDGSTDYIEIFGKNSSASPSFNSGSTNTYFSACWLRSL
jgi:hypothetical protein